MNASDQYLRQMLQKYSAKDLMYYTHQISLLKNNLQAWANTCYLEIINSGSRAKGTAISLASDVDYLVSLKIGCNENSGGLKGIYDSLYNLLGSLYPRVRKQNVSVRIDLPGNGLLVSALEVDITPAKKQDFYTTDHSLWLSKNSTWKKTNVQKHIYEISTSGRLNEIKLLKIWRELNKLEFPSIYLEYLLIKNVLSNKPYGDDFLASNFYYILQEFSKSVGNPLFSRIIDPANSNNILSELLTNREKNQIISKAQTATNQTSWDKIIVSVLAKTSSINFEIN